MNQGRVGDKRFGDQGSEDVIGHEDFRFYTNRHEKQLELPPGW